MSPLPIDLDTEAIQSDGRWYTRDELARLIKKMLDGGDFAVTRPSQALEQLTGTLGNLRTVAFRATPDMAEAITAFAAKQGKTLGAIVREAVSAYLAAPAKVDGPTGPPPAPAKHSPPLEVGQTPSGLHAIATRAAAEQPKPAPAAPQGPPVVLPGPGALKAAAHPLPSVVVDKAAIVTETVSPEEVASAVDLTPKKKDEEEAVERRWFGG